jgi:VanZ family protein
MSLYESWRTTPTVSDLDQSRPPSPDKSSIPPWLRAWGPALLWAILISLFSTDTFSAAHTGTLIEPLLRWLYPSITPAGIELAHHLIRKCAHFGEYFIFCLFLYHGIRATRRNSRPWHWSWALIAWLIAAVYSLFDEFHQVFVPSRGPSLWDSLLDSTAALCAIIFLFFFYRRFNRPRTF